MASKTKHLYRGDFNYAQETYIMFTRAQNDQYAYRNFTHKMSKKLGLTRRYVQNYFDGKIDNYRVIEVPDNE